MINEKEVIEALKVIQTVCEEAEDCNKCILRTELNACAIFIDSQRNLIYSPKDWILKDQQLPRVILN